MRVALTAVLVAVLAALTGYAVAVLPFHRYEAGEVEPLLVVTVLQWVVFAAAIVALRGVRGRAALVLVGVGAALIGGAGLLGPPNTSTDSARYAWDGIVQDAGVSPYAYVPADARLAELRPDWLFPAPDLDAPPGERCEQPRMFEVAEVGTGATLCTAINRSDVPTIYPPLAEGLFAGVRAIVGPDAEYAPLQVLGLVVSLGTTALLVVIARRRGLDPRGAALWAWCPLVTSEAVVNAHVDAVGALLLVAATALAARGRVGIAGAVLGAATSIKLLPLVGAPAIAGRRPWLLGLAAVAVFALGYVPYVITSGADVLGYLPGYLAEEGYGSGSRFVLVDPVLQGPAATALVAVVLVVTAVLVWRRTDPDAPWLGQLVLIGTVLIAASPRYPWYALLLVPFVAITTRWEWLTIGFVLALRVLVPSPELHRAGLVVALAVVVAGALIRSGPGRRSRLAGVLRDPLLLRRDRSTPARDRPRDGTPSAEPEGT